MEKKIFIGVDVGKQSLDVSVCKAGRVIYYGKMENTPTAIKKGVKQLAKTPELLLSQACWIMEYTGIYTFHLISYLVEQKMEFYVVPAIEVKRSSGLTRGKNDRVDSQRLAQYAMEKYPSLRSYSPPRKVIVELSGLVSLRSRILKSRQALETAMKESGSFMDPSVHKELISLQRSSISGLNKDLKRIELRIKQLIESDDQLHQLMKRITSVDGVGKITAVEVIITTNEFKNIKDPKKFACYSGIAPFEHSSGTSIRGKTRVSHMANKSVKCLLHMAALSSIKMKGEMKTYFERKVMEGKNKMSVLNAVRNKIVLRIFAVVNQNKIYQKSLV
jgi:transposase